jgi:endonuclease/exonuclease/phosphatase family metal-dependent hydrolase
MKIRTVLFVILLILFVCGLLLPLKSGAQEISLKVMTFNIKFNNPSDSIYNWNHRQSLVYDVFRNSKPDIAGLQEVLDSQLSQLRDTLEIYTWYGVGRDDGKKAGEYSPIGYLTSRFVKIDGSYFWLSKTPDVPGSKSWKTACTRMVTWLMLRDKLTGHNFFIFNTHFDHASEEARIESAKLLRKQIIEITGGRPVILTGDFNSTSKDEAYRILTDKSAPGYLQDTRASLPDSLKKPSYSFIDFPFRPEEGNLIDFIFTKNLPRVWHDGIYKIIEDNRNGFYPSDHLPVTVEFMIRPLGK